MRSADESKLAMGGCACTPSEREREKDQQRRARASSCRVVPCRAVPSRAVPTSPISRNPAGALQKCIPSTDKRSNEDAGRPLTDNLIAPVILETSIRTVLRRLDVAQIPKIGSQAFYPACRLACRHHSGNNNNNNKFQSLAHAEVVIITRIYLGAVKIWADTCFLRLHCIAAIA